MTISTGIAAAASKAAFTWLGGQLTQWLQHKNATAEQIKLWNDIAKKILKQTKTTAERYAKITTVAFPRSPAALDSIYIPLTLEGNNSEISTVIDSFPQELLSKHRKILIVDVAGMGKSTISRIMFLAALEGKFHLPVLIDLRRLDGSEEIENCLAKQFGLRPKHMDIFAEFLSTQPLLFLFDGFDEVPEKKKLEVARTIRYFVDRSDEGVFVMTSRPELPFGDYADFVSLHIKELTKEQAFRLIRKYGDAYEISERAKALIEELDAKHDGPVASFLKNPLLTSLLFRAFEFKSVVPVKRGVFYRQVFDALYEAHDLSKETGYVREKKTGLHHDDFHRTVRAMAKLFREKRVVEVSIEQFLLFAKKVSKELCPDLTFKPDDLLHDLLHAVPLFIKDGNLVRWAHKSLHDYFLCEFLLRDYSESKDEALRASSSGLNSRTNENFLALVYEADPILFAKAITLPAIDRLLARHANILEKIPKSVPLDVRDDIATFFMSHELVSSKSDDGGVNAWLMAGSDSLESDSLIEREKFVPQLLYHFGEQMSLGIYTHEAAVALNVLMSMGNLPYVTGHSITRSYPRISPGPELPETPRGFIGSRKTAKDWSSVEDDFTTLMGLLWGSELRIPTPEKLTRAKSELDIIVKASITARSNKLF